jgi:hypothetical protein
MNLKPFDHRFFSSFVFADQLNPEFHRNDFAQAEDLSHGHYEKSFGLKRDNCSNVKIAELNSDHINTKVQDEKWYFRSDFRQKFKCGDATSDRRQVDSELDGQYMLAPHHGDNEHK